MAAKFAPACENERSLLLLSKIGIQIHHLNRRFEARGMSIVQWCVLRNLVALPGSSAQELAAAVGVHPSTLTQSLKRLEQKKFLFVEDHPKDSRKKVLWATREGNEAVEQLSKEASSLLQFLSKIEAELISVDSALDRTLALE
jgi:DNA-binding MarR family transcriptional regulator